MSWCSTGKRSWYSIGKRPWFSEGKRSFLVGDLCSVDDLVRAPAEFLQYEDDEAFMVCVNKGSIPFIALLPTE
jgi:hypothetical protein